MGPARHAARSVGDALPIVISANSQWNIKNFRGGLMRGLEASGYSVQIAAPSDEPSTSPGTLGKAVVPIPVDRSGLNPFADFRLFLAYARLFRARRPLAFLSFTVKPNIYGALAARLTGVPSLPNVSGLGTAFLKGGLFAGFVGLLYRVAFRRSYVVFFQNPDDRDLFLGRRLVRPEQVRLLPGSGVDLTRFQPAAEASDGPPVFLFVGRLLGDKGVREFAEAARLLRPVLSGARFQILGSLDRGNRTAISAKELDGWTNDALVEYLGETEDVRPFLALATAVVLPSYREGLPRSLLEAAAMGKPLVATDVPGNREICEDGVTGLMCSARDAQSLADAMRRFAGLGPEARAMLGRAGRLRVEQQFSEDAVIAAYRDALQQLHGSDG